MLLFDYKQKHKNKTKKKKHLFYSVLLFIYDMINYLSRLGLDNVLVSAVAVYNTKWLNDKEDLCSEKT